VEEPFSVTIGKVLLIFLVLLKRIFVVQDQSSFPLSRDDGDLPFRVMNYLIDATIEIFLSSPQVNLTLRDMGG